MKINLNVINGNVLGFPKEYILENIIFADGLNAL